MEPVSQSKKSVFAVKSPVLISLMGLAMLSGTQRHDWKCSIPAAPLHEIIAHHLNLSL
jgi:hypothetical protein